MTDEHVMPWSDRLLLDLLGAWGISTDMLKRATLDFTKGALVITTEYQARVHRQETDRQGRHHLILQDMMRDTFTVTRTHTERIDHDNSRDEPPPPPASGD